MVDAIRTQIMNQMSDRRGASSSWAGVICSKMKYKLKMAYTKGRLWTINGLPCKHAVVAIRNNISDLNALVDPYFHVTNYQSSYFQVIFSIPTIEKPQVIPGHFGILPPTMRRPPDKPKKKRIPSKR
ncbi:hypothetical protein ACSBR1_002199 [Camellia fascicularis]